MNLGIMQKIGTIAMGFSLVLPALASPAWAQARPSYAGSDEDTVHGRIVSVIGQYDITIRDDRGYVDHVRLHQGTIINPTGLSLTPGMTVTVLGVNGGSVLAANEIDTPYNYSAAPAVAYGAPYGPGYYPGGYGYGYPGYGYGYPRYGYPVYGGYPYGYGYGYPTIGIGFRFGGNGNYRGGHDHGGHDRGGYGGHFHR